MSADFLVEVGTEELPPQSAVVVVAGLSRRDGFSI